MKTICITCKNDCNNAGTTARISWCPQYKPGRILSNAERIRAMSDDELLDFMKKSVANAYMCKIMRTEPMFLTLAWLQKPAEEDGQ